MVIHCLSRDVWWTIEFGQTYQLLRTIFSPVVPTARMILVLITDVPVKNYQKVLLDRFAQGSKGQGEPGQVFCSTIEFK